MTEAVAWIGEPTYYDFSSNSRLAEIIRLESLCQKPGLSGVMRGNPRD